MSDDIWLRKSKIDILRYLPYKLQKDYKFYTVNTAESREHENIRLILNDLLDQLFIDTATWGLDYFEEFLNIIPKANDDYQTRRTRIKILLNAHDVSTIKFMTDLANKFISDKSAQIIEHNSEYWFEVFFNIDGLISLGDLRAAIELYKPAHLGFKIVFYILSKILTSHKASITQYINANHNFWNLGGITNTYWDGIWNLNGSIDWSGFKPDKYYRERQTHLLEILYKFTPVQKYKIGYKADITHGIQSKIKIPISYKSNLSYYISLNLDLKPKNKVLNTLNINFKQSHTEITKNLWEGSFCMDGTHNWNGEYKPDKMYENMCTVCSTDRHGNEKGTYEVL